MKKVIITSLLVITSIGSVLANTETSRVYLARADEQLKSAQQLVEKAKNADKSESVQTFDYSALNQDISSVRQGIQDYLNDVRISPKNIQVLNANYDKQQ